MKLISEFVSDKTSKDGRTSACKKCRYAKTAIWSKNNRKRKKELNDQNKQVRKEYYSCPNRKLHLKNLELKRGFGISLDDYNKMLAEQNGVCAICCIESKSKRYQYLSVDHDHVTGKIRGLLCYLCNGAIGMLRDDPTVIRNAASYIERTRP